MSLYKTKPNLEKIPFLLKTNNISNVSYLALGGLARPRYLLWTVKLRHETPLSSKATLSVRLFLKGFKRTLHVNSVSL